ncbi:MAG: peptidoglycan DD-metalloendopeptidase family protein [Candidatus Cloacimonetes bacterium]|nr:peptidoglycan DD-metalloendopeptidase family protein [Candidatus Cloacimonadota bacterium]
MKKYILGIVLLLTVLAAYGQTLGDKQKELEELKKQISRQEEIIREAEAQKENKEQNLQKTQKTYKATDAKIKRLKKSEEAAKKELRRAKEQLTVTRQNLAASRARARQLSSEIHKEFYALFVEHFRPSLAASKQNTKALPLLIKGCIDLKRSTEDEIAEFEGTSSQLEKKRSKSQKDFENFQWSRIVAKKKKKKYEAEISTLSGDIASLENQRATAIERKNLLETEAKALDELLAKLRSEISHEAYSYIFSTDKLPWPARGEIIRPFGEEKSELYNVTLVNKGIDIALEEGHPVKAVEDGVVAFAAWYNGAGKMVIIDHQNGFFSLYSHNSSLLVSKGDSVNRSQTIALSGKTGSAEVPSLHFELRKRGTSVDPMKYLE